MSTNNAVPSKYEFIMEELLEQIKRNDFTYTSPICTEKQLSLKYDVSRITAKRAITELEQRGILYRKRGVGSFVSPDPGSFFPAARNREESKTVAFLLPFDITKGGLPDTAGIINSILSEHEYFMVIYVSNKDILRERIALKQLLNQNIAGLIYYPIRDKIYLNLMNQFVLMGKPVVILDKSTDCPYLSNIVSDNVRGGRLLADHLIRLGHKNIAFLCNAPIEETSSVRDRFGGMLEQMKAAQITLNPAFITEPVGILNEQTALCEHGNPLLNKTVRQLCDAGATAIIAENDEIAYYILISCHELGIRVPEDLSVCGFDNNDWSRLWPKRITTISQDFNVFGELAAKILLKTLRAPNTPPERHIIPVSLIKGGTTAPPKS